MRSILRSTLVAVEKPLTGVSVLHRYSHQMTKVASRGRPWTHMTWCGHPMRNMEWIEMRCAPQSPDQARVCRTCFFTRG